MMAVLEPCLRGEHAWIGERLALAGARREAIPAHNLLEPGTIRHIVAQFAELYPDGDQRAVVSLWAQWYFLALVTPSVAAALCLGRVLPVDIGEIGVAFDSTGRPDTIVLDNDGIVPPHGAAPLFKKLVSNNLEPLIASMCQSFEIAPRVLWSNAGTVIEWTLTQFAPSARDANALAKGRQLLQQRSLAGKANPLYEPVRYAPENGALARRRRVCCLRYRLDGVAHCGNLCPLPSVRNETQ
jgi:ferric iron reductase protein FhuF